MQFALRILCSSSPWFPLLLEHVDFQCRQGPSYREARTAWIGHRETTDGTAKPTWAGMILANSRSILALFPDEQQSIHTMLIKTEQFR